METVRNELPSFYHTFETVYVSDSRLTINDPCKRWRARAVPLYDIALLWK